MTGQQWTLSQSLTLPPIFDLMKQPSLKQLILQPAQLHLTGQSRKVRLHSRVDEKKEQALLRLREEKKGYFTRLATELTQGSRKERASRQLRQQKVELRNTEEKRIQLNLSLRAVQRRESKVNGQWRIYPSPGFILNRPICRDDIQHESKKKSCMIRVLILPTQFLQFMGVARTAQFKRLAAYQRARSAILFFSPVDATRQEEKKEHKGFSKASSPVSAESIDSPGTSLPQLGTFKEGAYTKVYNVA